MNKKAFGLLYAIFILLLLSSLSILIFQNKSTKKELLVKENLYNQAYIHLYSTIDLLHKLDLINNHKTNLKIDDNQFDIEVIFYYISKENYSNTIYKLDDNDTKNKEMIKATITIKSIVSGYEDIQIVKTVMLKIESDVN